MGASFGLQRERLVTPFARGTETWHGNSPNLFSQRAGGIRIPQLQKCLLNFLPVCQQSVSAGAGGYKDTSWTRQVWHRGREISGRDEVAGGWRGELALTHNDNGLAGFCPSPELAAGSMLANFVEIRRTSYFFCQIHRLELPAQS